MSEEVGKYSFFNMRPLSRKLEKTLGITRYSEVEAAEVKTDE